MKRTPRQKTIAAEADLDRFEPPEYLLAKLNSRIRDLMNAALRTHGLKLVEWRLLQCLADAEQPRTVAELADLAVIDRTVASRVIDRMAARGLVNKQAMAQDRRFVSVTSSQAGLDLFNQSNASAQDARRRLFQGLSEAEIDDLLRLLETMNANAESPVRSASSRRMDRKVSGG